MKITKEQKGTTLTLTLEGRLDTTTAPELEQETRDLTGVKELTIDMAALEYISSAGLRALLSTQKAMNRQSGKMLVRSPNETVREVFDITGFSDILTIC